eukprot:6203050-Pleurochrysis_carterae.AAC.2
MRPSATTRMMARRSSRSRFVRTGALSKSSPTDGTLVVAWPCGRCARTEQPSTELVLHALVGTFGMSGE